MRTTALLALVFCVAASPLCAGTQELRQIERTFELEGRTSVRLDLPVAEVRIEGTDGKTVEVDLTATCKRDSDCKEVLAALDLAGNSNRSGLRIDLIGYPKWGKGRLDVEVAVLVPRGLDVEVELGVGELEFKNLTGNLRAELGVGEINAWLPRSAVHTVTLDAGVGESELYGVDGRVEGRRSMLVGSEVNWDEGEGAKRIFFQVGVGEISVWLE